MLKLRLIFGLLVFLTSGLCLADNGSEAGGDGAFDRRMFIKGSTVTVLVNYNQFIDTEFLANHPTVTQKNVVSAVQMAIDRWTQVTSMNLKINYGGLTTKTSPGEGEILIGAATDEDGPGRFASASPDETNDVTNGNCSLRFFRRTSGIENDWFVFNFKDYPSGGMFISAVLMHEFGHCLGLHHNPNGDSPSTEEIDSLRTVMLPHPTLHAAYGPYIEDVEDLVAMYGTRGKVQLDVVLSTDDGLAWNSINPNIPTLGITQTPVLNRDNARMVMFFTDRNRRPAYIKANNQGHAWDASPTLFSNSRSLFGTTGSGSSDEYMLVWVNPDDKNYVNIAYTPDAGMTWDDRSPGFRAASAPSVRKIENDTWVISYLHLDENTFKNENGRVLTRVSTDDGRTWSRAYELAVGMRALGGVTVTSANRNLIRIGFVRTNENDDRYTTSLTTIAAHLNSNNSLSRDNWVSSGSQFSTSEASFTTTSRVFVQAFETSGKRLTSCNSTFDAAGWPTCAAVNPFTYRGMPPAVAGKTNSNWVYMVKEK